MGQTDNHVWRPDRPANLGRAPAAVWALHLLQKNVWEERTKSARDSQMRKYMRFARGEGRGCPPGDLDLVAYISWLLFEGSVSANSFRNYLSAIQLFCEGEKLLPLSPTPTKSRLLMDILGTAFRCEGRFPVRDLKKRASLSAMNAAQALVWGRRASNWKSRRRAASWQVGFCFSFRGGTLGAM